MPAPHVYCPPLAPPPATATSNHRCPQPSHWVLWGRRYLGHLGELPPQPNLSTQILNPDGSTSGLTGNRILVQSDGGGMADMIAHPEQSNSDDLEDFDG